ncbi:hypothetical protein TRFO_13180 [Tritrichomonas foetus]|uniref:Uncharacterized protein n=1 Tax=Tritrichomonas foetus TaxID=1144522 RepID=A0A1J4L3S9_9EUKA|nr:hypothetical protein TRFO_13180 [Tritrichomonas foetus]|eukprot:OHT16573.1 hypothetical protein TRFO_13180 [Tritrichomonas foetus]
MFWLIFVISSTLLGWSIVQIIRLSYLPFFVNLGLAWTIGSMISSLGIFIIHFILPLNAFILVLIIAGQMALIYYIQQYLHTKFKNDYNSTFQIRLENSPKYYLVLFIIAVFSTYHLLKSYSNFPDQIPAESREIIDSEMSFIASIRYGVNKRRRNIFFYKDPQNLNQHYSSATLPLLFTASMCSLGCGYAEASVFIAFLNTMTTAIFVFYYTFFFSKHAFSITLCFMLNGGWSIFRALFGSTCENNDYLRNVCARAPVPWHSTFGVLLSYSKSASFSIPLSIISILFSQFSRKQNTLRMQYLIGGIAASLIPNVGPSMCVFLIASCFAPSFKYFMPFAVSIIPKLFGVKIHNFPIWREYQMAGIFYAPIMTWLDQFGPMIISIFMPIRSLDDQFTLHRFLAFASGFLLLNFFRFGNGNFENILAVTSTILPAICMHFVEDLYEFVNFTKDQLKRSVISTLSFLLYLTFIMSGILSIYTLTQKNTIGLTNVDSECGNWMRKNLHKNDVIFSESVSFNPASNIAGRQIVCGDLKSLWSSGSNVTAALRLIREVERLHNPYEVMNRMNIQYFLVSEGSAFANMAIQAGSNFSRVYQNVKWTLYKLN